LLELSMDPISVSLPPEHPLRRRYMCVAHLNECRRQIGLARTGTSHGELNGRAVHVRTSVCTFAICDSRLQLLSREDTHGRGHRALRIESPL